MQGTPICPSYSLYRLCLYGSTCKFDHPIDGYSYAYSVPPFPTYPPSTFYPTISSLVPSSNTPCSKPADWIKKGANNDVNYQNQRSSANSIVDSTDVTDSRPCSSEPSTGRHRDETDWSMWYSFVCNATALYQAPHPLLLCGDLGVEEAKGFIFFFLAP